MRLKQHDKAEEYARSALAFPGGSQVGVLHLIHSLQLTSMCAGVGVSFACSCSRSSRQDSSFTRRVFHCSYSKRSCNGSVRTPPTMFSRPLPRFTATTSGPTCSSMLANAKLLPEFCNKGRFTTRVGSAVVWAPPSSCEISDIHKMRSSCAAPTQPL